MAKIIKRKLIQIYENLTFGHWQGDGQILRLHRKGKNGKVENIMSIRLIQNILFIKK